MSKINYALNIGQKRKDTYLKDFEGCFDDTNTLLEDSVENCWNKNQAGDPTTPKNPQGEAANSILAKKTLSFLFTPHTPLLNFTSLLPNNLSLGKKISSFIYQIKYYFFPIKSLLRRIISPCETYL